MIPARRVRVAIGRYLLVIATWMACTAITQAWRLLMAADFGEETRPQETERTAPVMTEACLLAATMILADLAGRAAARRLGWRRYGWAPAIALAGLAAYALARHMLTAVPYRFCLILAGLIMVPSDREGANDDGDA